MQISAYHVLSISVTAHHGDRSHWVEMKVREGGREVPSTDIMLFMEGPDAAAKADAYAAAINGVNEPAKPAPESEEEFGRYPIEADEAGEG
jgi:hypothetical protein